MKKPKILLLFSGGTIAMIANLDETLAPAPYTEEFTTLIPELKDRYDIDSQFITSVDSTNIQVTHWEKIATIIEANFNNYDGFVITHGTDTMSFTASAVSFALQDIGKPVVFTGAQLPITHWRSDAKLNLINAMEVANMDLSEVVIVFGSRIIRANRSTKISESHFSAFTSNKYPILGTIKTDITLDNFHNPRTDKRPTLKANFDENIVVLPIIPGLDPKYFDALIDSGAAGIIVTAVGAGNIPNGAKPLHNSIKRATEMNIPVVIATQCHHGTVNMNLYETGMAALEAGAISGQDMTLEAACTKLMWALGQTHSLNQIREIMITDIAGELTAK